MNILSIESSSIVCGTALYLKDNLVDIDEVTMPRIHGERLPVMIETILKKNDLEVSDLDGIAISAGPGSYTGLRIGMSLAKGLAVAVGIPIIPVPTLEAINRGVSREGLYWVVLHSHKNIIYAQRFNSGRPDSEVECAEFDSKRYTYPVGFNLDVVCKPKEYEIASPSSQYVCELAIEHFNQWAEINLNTITPNYVTNFNLGKVSTN